ncbi:prepilin-type N-terminal cleavage/methylation domain-containing protein [bacterium]|nr:MAG: prepilin-type N-terminal cleavage/methylation domain-containing protein [bacterium]
MEAIQFVHCQLRFLTIVLIESFQFQEQLPMAKHRIFSAYKSSAHQAFSLVEILLVLLIVGLLSAILLSVFSRQREMGYRARCQTNLSQIFKAMQMYLQDSDSRFPSYDTWATALEPYVKNKQTFVCPSVSDHFSYHPDVDYETFPDRISHKVLSFLGKTTRVGAHESTLTSFVDWILITDIGSGEKPSVKMLDYPEDCALKLRGRRSLGRNFCQIHAGGGNYLFADGHVKWLLPEAGMQADCAAGPFIKDEVE